MHFEGRHSSGNAFSTDAAGGDTQSMNGGKALIANGQSGDVQNGSRAKPAVGGKKCGEKAARSFDRFRGNTISQDLRVPGMPGRGSLKRRNGGAGYVSGTAEDQPPSPGAWSGSSRTNRIQYSGVVSL
jgi:hypothetical protein